MYFISILVHHLILVVLSRRGMRTPTNSYLTAIAIADLIYLISVLWLSFRHYSYVNEDPFWSFIYSHVWPYSLYLADATSIQIFLSFLIRFLPDTDRK